MLAHTKQVRVATSGLNLRNGLPDWQIAGMCFPTTLPISDEQGRLVTEDL